MNNICYLKGDATNPVGEGNKVICHVCNDIGGWGAGFVLAISKKWDNPEREYRKWHKEGMNSSFKLGNVQFVKVDDNIAVANMIGQHLTHSTIDANGNVIPPIRYSAVKDCLNKVAKYAIDNKCSVHMPMIGSGLAGGDWNIIESIIIDTLVNNGVETYVYVFEK